jgi:signal transduction histidine kinase
VEAMPERGNLTIQAENAWTLGGDVAALKEGAYLKITFTDDGIGIPEEHRLKIFESCYTSAFAEILDFDK